MLRENPTVHVVEIYTYFCTRTYKYTIWRHFNLFIDSWWNLSTLELGVERELFLSIYFKFSEQKDIWVAQRQARRCAEHAFVTSFLNVHSQAHDRNTHFSSCLNWKTNGTITLERAWNVDPENGLLYLDENFSRYKGLKIR